MSALTSQNLITDFNRSQHRRSRLPTESSLDNPHVRTAETDQKMMRPGEGQNVVPHAAVLIVPLNQEPLLPVPAWSGNVP